MRSYQRKEGMITMHPGQFIQEVYLIPMKMSQADLARRLGVDSSTVSRMLRGEAEVTASMALKLATVFDVSAEYWLEMQLRYSLEKARKALK